MYLCVWCPNGPNCACCLAIRRASAGEGGRNSVVGGSSIFALSALAVDKDMVGNDSDGELICGEGELTKPCCWVAARRAAVAVCISLFDFGEVEKKLPNLFTLGEDALRGSSCFSLYVVVEVEDGEVLTKGFMSLRDITCAVELLTWSRLRAN